MIDLKSRPRNHAKIPTIDGELAGDRVLLRRIDPYEKSKGGILIPQTARIDKGYRCQVLAMGPGQLASTEDRFLPLMPVKDSAGKPTSRLAIGDIVLIGEYGYTDVTIDQEDYIIVSAHDVKYVFPREGE
jgi:chaperonin GroES